MPSNEFNYTLLPLVLSSFVLLMTNLIVTVVQTLKRCQGEVVDQGSQKYLVLYMYGERLLTRIPNNTMFIALMCSFVASIPSIVGCFLMTQSVMEYGWGLLVYMVLISNLACLIVVCGVTAYYWFFSDSSEVNEVTAALITIAVTSTINVAIISYLIHRGWCYPGFRLWYPEHGQAQLPLPAECSRYAAHYAGYGQHSLNLH
jgi:hypothetical protein